MKYLMKKKFLLKKKINKKKLNINIIKKKVNNSSFIYYSNLFLISQNYNKNFYQNLINSTQKKISFKNLQQTKITHNLYVSTSKKNFFLFLKTKNEKYINNYKNKNIFLLQNYNKNFYFQNIFYLFFFKGFFLFNKKIFLMFWAFASTFFFDILKYFTVNSYLNQKSIKTQKFFRSGGMEQKYTKGMIILKKQSPSHMFSALERFQSFIKNKLHRFSKNQKHRYNFIIKINKKRYFRVLGGFLRRFRYFLGIKKKSRQRYHRIFRRSRFKRYNSFLFKYYKKNAKRFYAPLYFFIYDRFSLDNFFVFPNYSHLILKNNFLFYIFKKHLKNNKLFKQYKYKKSFFIKNKKIKAKFINLQKQNKKIKINPQYTFTNWLQKQTLRANLKQKMLIQNLSLNYLNISKISLNKFHLYDLSPIPHNGTRVSINSVK